jgi:Protein of unknown function C-terminus (DUF2451)
MLENEVWTRCPVAPKYSINDVKEFTECLSTRPPVPATSPPLHASINKVPKSAFGTIFSNGNPFSKMIQYQKRKAAPAHAAAAAAAAAAQAKQAVVQQQENDDDSDDEPAELRADYIDEDTDGPAVVRSQPQRAASEDKGPVIATTAIAVVRLLAKYIHLLQVLHQSLGLEVFVAIVQLVEYYVYNVYSIFGSPPPGSGLTQDDLVASMSRPLRKMITRLKERFAPPPPVLLSAVGVALPTGTDGQSTKASANGTPHDLVKIKWTLVRPTVAQVAELTSPKQGYGIAMRTVGIESLLFLAEAINKARNTLQQLTPPTASEFFTTFYTHAGLIAELRTHMYKAAASGLLTVDTIGKAVETVKWDTSLVSPLFLPPF